jgi:hypothetical protein
LGDEKRQKPPSPKKRHATQTPSLRKVRKRLYRMAVKPPVAQFDKKFLRALTKIAAYLLGAKPQKETP